MKKLQVDPKGMAVVKKTITATLPGKTKGGVPLEPKAREKFYNDEIDRHYELLQKTPIFMDSKGNPTKEGLVNQKKADQIIASRDFLLEQLNEFKSQLSDKAKAKKDAADQAKFRTERAARPIGEKVMDFIRTTGGTGGYGGS
jgi:hypothetical protein